MVSIHVVPVVVSLIISKVLISFRFKGGAVIPKPYLFVEHYPIMKDICYQMRERGMTFEEAESRIKEMEDDLHISIARTQIYWNNVISRMANNRTNKKLVLQNTLKFIDEHHVPMSPEIYYSLLHTITSIEDYTKVKGVISNFVPQISEN